MKRIALALSGLLMAALPAFSGDVTKGEALYDHWCAICHAAGPMYPGTQALAMRHEGDVPAVLAERDDLDGYYITYVVRNGLSIMPFFRKTELSDADMDDMVAYLTRNNPQ